MNTITLSIALLLSYKAAFLQEMEKHLLPGQHRVIYPVEFKLEALPFKAWEGVQIGGLCDLSTRTISIDKTDVANLTEVEIVVFHELGHCILDRDHKNTWIDLGDGRMPSSIMNAKNIIETRLYEKYRDYYLDELFVTH